MSADQRPRQLKSAEGLLSRKKDALLPVGIHGNFKKDRSATESAVLPFVSKPLNISMLTILSDKITAAIQENNITMGQCVRTRFKRINNVSECSSCLMPV